MQSYRFEQMPQSWAKRRKLDTPTVQVVDFTVYDFECIDGHRCNIDVVLDNGEAQTLSARVYANSRYEMKGNELHELITSWGVQAINPDGFNLVLRVHIDDKELSG